MKANVQFLNVGWGDSHIIQLPSGLITLIDGGDGALSDEQDHPLNWMERNGIDQLDWMILTHIHEDHLNGLVDIVKCKKVDAVILPYQPFNLANLDEVKFSGNETALRVFNMLKSYLTFISLLEKQGTKIKWRSEYGAQEKSIVWSEDGFVLTHMYPWIGDPLPAYDTLQEFLEGQESISNKEIADLERLFKESNDDSSVYRLSADSNPTENILFGGDQLEEGWKLLSSRTPLKSLIWKVSHHGMEDAFTKEVLELIQPECCVIPISADRSAFLLPHWDELRLLTDAPFYLTGSIQNGDSFQLFEGETLNVQIGY
ncbi:ComEC/Rec2 family competence protein [Peribacillus huizhouensis]|uniref:Beta-lactamase superfamily II metal-dependent hydrolase n=1 Tax=Peribacillus huizhouensis TaxID=1501239 RepID=A0ABR6CN10_9BACI|nr:MBL fold metallo-hydrolase [Peribacillus huizhouensis]MBA9026389.1 beta-lactamase superfamily II metal-dependent hydrolase [Peribacillus huizhouensis]